MAFITKKKVTCGVKVNNEAQKMENRDYIKPVLLLIFAFLLLLTSCPLLFAQGQMIKGNASYYADKFHGQRTASGEIYNKDSMTCAHLKYPFGTILKVRNPLNDRTVYVRVTDRGPYHKHRVIDLSRAAARELGIIQAGFSMVEITPFHTVESPYLPGDDGLPDIPELELQYTPAATFPEPIWKNDTIKVTEKLKQVTSKWTFPSL